jgi:hypothetical protein
VQLIKLLTLNVYEINQSLLETKPTVKHVKFFIKLANEVLFGDICNCLMLNVHIKIGLHMGRTL